MTEVRDISLERPAVGGAVGRLPDGRVIFVRHGLPGEVVDVEVTEEHTTYARGEAVALVTRSSGRVEPPCPYAVPGGCGGCDLQHASPEAQREWKVALVAEQLLRVARVERDVTLESAPSPARGSRTRLRAGVDDEGRLGLRVWRSHDLVGVDDCWLADERFAAAFAREWPGNKDVELRAIGEGEPFAVLHRTDGAVDVASFEGRLLSPSTSSRVEVNGHTFRVGPRSFWQSHRDAPAVLTDAVLGAAGAKPGDTVTDLYAGVGLFSVPLARATGRGGRVTAVESAPWSVADARHNVEGAGRVQVRQWDVTARAVNDAVAPDAIVVVDPPRTGLGRGVATALARRAPRRLVYVSCDPATFARDLSALLMGGFALGDLRAFDLFPMTEHVELVARLDFIG